MLKNPIQCSVASIVLLWLTVGLAIAQPRPIGLTNETRAKLETIASPEKKLIRYKKFIHKDSIRYFKEANKYWQSKSDSLTAIITGTTRKWEAKHRKLSERWSRKLDRINGQGAQLTSQLNSKVSSIPRGKLDSLPATNVSLPLDTTSILKVDAITGMPVTQPPDLPLKQMEIPSAESNIKDAKSNATADLTRKLSNNDALREAEKIKNDGSQYSGDLEKYKQYSQLHSDSMKQLATSKAKSEADAQLAALTGFKDTQKELRQLNEMKQLQSQYTGRLGGLSRPDSIKQIVEGKAMEYLSKNPASMQEAQKQLNYLLRKYSYVPNSNDLSTAVKRTSLKGKSLRERLVIALNLQIPSYDPFIIDFAPQVGYRFNSRLAAGIGGTYRQTFRDQNAAIAPEVAGYKLFTNYDVFKSFFAYGEYANNTPGKESKAGESVRVWSPAAWLGLGKRFSVHKKLDMTVLAIYNVIHKPNDPIYPQAFVVRVGFQLSDQALFKKKPNIPKW